MTLGELQAWCEREVLDCEEGIAECRGDLEQSTDPRSSLYLSAQCALSEYERRLERAQLTLHLLDLARAAE